jgi:hypothetical protein
MGTLFSLGAVKPTVRQALDDLITELGKACRLVYPPRWVPCGDCIFDAVGNKSSNIWRTGGPVPFGAGTTCPLCNGAGKSSQEVSEVVTMLCAWDPRDFYVPVPRLDLRVPNGFIQTKGYLTDAPKMSRADHAIFELPLENSLRQTFKLAGEPVDVSNIIQGRYCVATWKRVLL